MAKCISVIRNVQLKLEIFVPSELNHQLRGFNFFRLLFDLAAMYATTRKQSSSKKSAYNLLHMLCTFGRTIFYR